MGAEQYKCLTCGGRIVFQHCKNGYAVYKCLSCDKRFMLKMRDVEEQASPELKENR